jgi:hypothetical protein
MFSDTEDFKPKRPAKIPLALMQMGKKELFGNIAKIWVEKRQWVLYTQVGIAQDSSANLSLKTAKRSGFGDSIKYFGFDRK